MSSTYSRNCHAARSLCRGQGGLVLLTASGSEWENNLIESRADIIEHSYTFYNTILKWTKTLHKVLTDRFWVHYVGLQARICDVFLRRNSFRWTSNSSACQAQKQTILDSPHAVTALLGTVPKNICQSATPRRDTKENLQPTHPVLFPPFLQNGNVHSYWIHCFEFGLNGFS